MRPSPFLLILASALAAGPAVARGGSADGLMRLVPPDAGATLALEDLRTRVRAIGAAPLPQKIRRVPAIQALLGSERARQLDRAARDIEASLGVPLATIRDEILGDAVVLAFVPGPTGAPEQSHGLLILQPRDQALLLRLVAAFNASQSRGGDLAAVDRRERGASTYWERRFKPGGRPTEFYAHLDDGTFAWSNSEGLVQDVIERKARRRPSLKDNLAFLKARKALPEEAVASLYVNPRLIERAMGTSPGGASPGPDRFGDLLGRFLKSVGYVGLALDWRDGPVIHMVEAIEPAGLDPWLKSWLTDPEPPADAGLLGQVPESALAIVAGHVDFEAARDAFRELTPEDDRPALENWRVGVQGLLLGEDPNAVVLPRLGPGALAYIDSRAETGSPPLFPIVAAVGWSDRPGSADLSAPIDNALRTLMAIYALDPGRKADHLRVAPRKVGGVDLTTLTDGLRTHFAFAVSRNRIVAGNGAEAVARFGSGRPPSPMLGLRERYFPEAETFAVFDLVRLAGEIRQYRGPVADLLAARSKRPAAEVDLDLGQILGVMDLFRAASFTSVAEKDASTIRQTARLIAR